jgi:subtilase family serine protease
MISARSRRFALALIATALACLCVSALASSRSAPRLLLQPAAVSPSDYVVHPLVVPASVSVTATPAAPGAGLCPDPTIACYAPADIRKVYDFPSGDGAGQTIIILVAFGNAAVQQDLAAFNSTFKLPPASLTIVGPNGTGDPTDPVAAGWAVEASFGVEWAHALAPAANIVLAVAKNDQAKELNHTLAKVAPQYPGAIIAQSFGSSETFVKRDFIDNKESHLIYIGAAGIGDTVLASTGDCGASMIDPSTGECGGNLIAQYPATDPLVTAVGGTMGFPGTNDLSNNGGYGGEQAWNEFGFATGGGPSEVFPQPPYQTGLPYSKRTVPDVAINASFIAGLLTYATVFSPSDGQVKQRFNVFGGTSAGPVLWAAIFAIANQARAAKGLGPLGPANPALYGIYNHAFGNYSSDFHDVVAGNNDIGFGGYSAGSGYDLTTGLGSPDVANLVNDLLLAPGVSLQNGPHLPDASCSNQTLNGAYRNVRVQRNSTCTLAGATVLGDVQANQAAGLAISGSTVFGNVRVDRTGGFGMTGSTVSGDLQVSNTTGAADPLLAGTNVVCNSIVWSTLDINGSGKTAPWSIGGVGCAADVTGSTGSVIGKDLRFNNNQGPANDMVGNTVVKNIHCNHNASLTGQGNQAGGHVDGQCTAIATELGDEDDDS